MSREGERARCRVMMIVRVGEKEKGDNAESEIPQAEYDQMLYMLLAAFLPENAFLCLCVMFAAPPNAPENISVTVNSTTGHIELSWETPSSGTFPEFYVVETRPSSYNITTSDLWATFNRSLLTEGFPYQFYARAGTAGNGLGDITNLSEYVVPGTV